jgi:tryptophan-rich sensory protein
MSRLLIFTLFLLITFGAGFLGMFLGGDFMTYYMNLNRPFFSPEPFVFGIVWPVLYILIALSAYMYFIKAKKDYKKGLFVFFLNLVLNSLWSFLFFGLKNPMLGLIGIIILIGITVINIYLFNKKSKRAALFMVPYFLWIMFAAVLNYSIIILN